MTEVKLEEPVSAPALGLDGDLMHPAARPLRSDGVAESL
ncbi:hypothetical protein HaLaN_25046, partial [Haematococcus lacustris]